MDEEQLGEGKNYRLIKIKGQPYLIYMGQKYKLDVDASDDDLKASIPDILKAARNKRKSSAKKRKPSFMPRYDLINRFTPINQDVNININRELATAKAKYDNELAELTRKLKEKEIAEKIIIDMAASDKKKAEDAIKKLADETADIITKLNTQLALLRVDTAAYIKNLTDKSEFLLVDLDKERDKIEILVEELKKREDDIEIRKQIIEELNNIKAIDNEIMDIRSRNIKEKEKLLQEERDKVKVITDEMDRISAENAKKIDLLTNKITEEIDAKYSERLNKARNEVIIADEFIDKLNDKYADSIKEINRIRSTMRQLISQEYKNKLLQVPISKLLGADYVSSRRKTNNDDDKYKWDGNKLLSYGSGEFFPQTNEFKTFRLVSDRDQYLFDNKNITPEELAENEKIIKPLIIEKFFTDPYVQYGKGVISQGLTNVELDTLMADVPGYLGAFPIDNLPVIDRNKSGSYIYNTMPAPITGHWRAVIVEPDVIMHFDSFGEEPSQEIIDKYKGSGRQFKINKLQVQPDNSVDCGYYCVRFLYDMAAGKTFKQATQFVDGIEETKSILSDFKII